MDNEKLIKHLWNTKELWKTGMIGATDAMITIHQALEEQFKNSGEAIETVKHVCGLVGFDGMKGDRCPACERFFEKREQKND
jgi:hypothetical protein